MFFHYRELKQDLVVILNCYKEQINAAHDHLQDCWGDTYVKVLSNIRWFKKELHKLRHRHNRACRACENVERRLNALQQEVPERVLKPQREPSNMVVRQRSMGNTKPVCVQFPHYHGRKVVVRTKQSEPEKVFMKKRFNIKHAPGKWNASNVHRRSTDGPHGIARSRT